MTISMYGEYIASSAHNPRAPAHSSRHIFHSPNASAPSTGFHNDDILPLFAGKLYAASHNPSKYIFLTCKYLSGGSYGSVQIFCHPRFSIFLYDHNISLHRLLHSYTYNPDFLSDPGRCAGIPRIASAQTWTCCGIYRLHSGDSVNTVCLSQGLRHIFSTPAAKEYNPHAVLRDSYRILARSLSLKRQSRKESC